MLMTNRLVLEQVIARLTQKIIGNQDVVASDIPVVLETPKVAEHGDMACNIAMQMAKTLKAQGSHPRAFAEQLVDELKVDTSVGSWFSAIEIAGPGFINFRFQPTFWQNSLKTLLEAGQSFGQSKLAKGKMILEFVSANPTGPLHVGHGRQAALGDALANLLQTQGWQVHREFYYNDAGVQIENLALSVQARLKGLKPGMPTWPENAYNGEYIDDIANSYAAGDTVCASDGLAVVGQKEVDDLQAIRNFAVTYLRHQQDLDLACFGVKFDQYYLESSLYLDGYVDDVVNRLTQENQSYESEGALWLKTTDFGDDKDRVMRKADGGYTYFVPDVAYHRQKWRRGFTKAINIQGSDHHGTIARVRAGLQGLHEGISDGYPDYILHKMVTVMKDGQEVKISKRAGSYVTVRDLIEWSGNGDLIRGRDIVRFFLLSRKADTEFVFDIDLALKQTDENPVFYVQFAHARICSILRNVAGDAISFEDLLSELLSRDWDTQTFAAPEVVALVKLLTQYPLRLQLAAQDMAPHDLTFYLREVASHFHKFYAGEKILTALPLSKNARLAVLFATKQVIANGLQILGVSCPESM